MLYSQDALEGCKRGVRMHTCEWCDVSAELSYSGFHTEHTVANLPNLNLSVSVNFLFLKVYAAKANRYPKWKRDCCL